MADTVEREPQKTFSDYQTETFQNAKVTSPFFPSPSLLLPHSLSPSSSLSASLPLSLPPSLPLSFPPFPPFPPSLTHQTVAKHAQEMVLKSASSPEEMSAVSRGLTTAYTQLTDSARGARATIESAEVRLYSPSCVSYYRTLVNSNLVRYTSTALLLPWLTAT